MKIERYKDETDEEWDERLVEEVSVANDYRNTLYFVKQDSYNEDKMIIHYISPDAWTWKEHPEGPFSCKQIMEWKQKYHLWEELMGLSSTIKYLNEMFQWLVEHMTVVSKE